jgi:hypothetical protein
MAIENRLPLAAGFFIGPQAGQPLHQETLV